MLRYGVFEWVFWFLAFGLAITTLVRGEVLSTADSLRQNRNSGRQVFMWFLVVVFALAGFLMAIISLRVGAE